MHSVDDWWATKRRQVPAPQVPGVVPVGGGSGYGEEHSIHLPQPSYWPIVASIGLLVAGYGVVYSVPVMVIGAAITMVATYAWAFEPVNEPEAQVTEGD